MQAIIYPAPGTGVAAHSHRDRKAVAYVHNAPWRFMAGSP